MFIFLSILKLSTTFKFLIATPFLLYIWNPGLKMPAYKFLVIFKQISQLKAAEQ